ncbi:MAG TPA: DUF3943 domain-containing protein [Polyangiaceae bacterium]|jgi:hypothetical protein|nr:DUF3943 domain-containing protein [Polyangiaceae bacterium]
MSKPCRAALRAAGAALWLFARTEPAHAEDKLQAAGSERHESQPAPDDALEPHHARSLVEMGAGLALGSVLYWAMMNRNIADWDNPTPQERFDGRAWRLDNNSLAINFIAHPLMGGAAYSFARANHHGPLVSFGYSFLTSFLWEFVLEFKEKVSVNDVIVTPTTGVPIGEFFYKLGLYLGSAERPNTGMRIAQWSLGTGVSLDRALDQRRPLQLSSRDALGLSTAIWHEFELDYAFAQVSSAGSPDYARYQAAARGRLVTLRGYLRPGTFGRSFQRAEISDFAIASEVSRHGAGLSMDADTLLAGYHVQDFAGSERALRGYAATFGASLAYSYLRSKANDYSAFRQAAAQPEPALSYHVPTDAEQFSAVHLPGPALDWQVRAPALALFIAARAHPDFAALGAPSFYDWAAANPQEKAKHILHRQGYFYGWGASAGLSGRLELGPLRLAAQIFHGRYRSQDGLDRHIEQLTVDVPAEGQVLFYSASLGIKPPLLPFSLGADWGVREWQSTVGGYARKARSTHRGLVISWSL